MTTLEQHDRGFRSRVVPSGRRPKGPQAGTRGAILRGLAVTLLAGTMAAAQTQRPDPRGSAPASATRGAPSEDSIPLGTPQGSPAKSGAQAAPVASASRFGGVQTMLALGGVLVVAGAGAYLLRRTARRSGGLWSAVGAGGRSPAGIVEVLGRYPLTRGQTLLLLRLDRRVLLVGQSGGSRLSAPSMTTLSEVTEAEEVASILTKARDVEEEKAAARFTSLLRRFDGEHAVAASTAVIDVKPAREGPVAVGPGTLRQRIDELRPVEAAARLRRTA